MLLVTDQLLARLRKRQDSFDCWMNVIQMNFFSDFDENSSFSSHRRSECRHRSVVVPRCCRWSSSLLCHTIIHFCCHCNPWLLLSSFLLIRWRRQGPTIAPFLQFVLFDSCHHYPTNRFGCDMTCGTERLKMGIFLGMTLGSDTEKIQPFLLSEWKCSKWLNVRVGLRTCSHWPDVQHRCQR